MNKKVQTITKTVKKATITHLKAEETIWRAMDKGGVIVVESCGDLITAYDFDSRGSY